MAAGLGKVSVQFTARTDKFRKGVKSAEHSMVRFRDRVMGVRRAVAAFSAAAVAAGAAALAIFVKRAAKTIDQTAKLADVLGLTTEQLIGYQHAAELSGVSSEELATGFRRMLKNISDANVGLTTAVRAFDALQVDFRQLILLKPDEQFKAIADGFANIPDQATKARVAQDLFGRSGIKMLKIVEEGSAGIERMARETTLLGSTFTREGARRVEQMNDSFTRLSGAFQGFVNRLTIALAGPLAHLFTFLSGALSGMANLIGSMHTAEVSSTSLARTFVTAFAAVEKAILKVNVAFSKANRFFLQSASEKEVIRKGPFAGLTGPQAVGVLDQMIREFEQRIKDIEAGRGLPKFTDIVAPKIRAAATPSITAEERKLGGGAGGLGGARAPGRFRTVELERIALPTKATRGRKAVQTSDPEQLRVLQQILQVLGTGGLVTGF